MEGVRKDQTTKKTEKIWKNKAKINVETCGFLKKNLNKS